MKQALLACCAMLLFLENNAQQREPGNRLDTLPKIILKEEPRFMVNVHGGYSLALGSTFKFYPDDVKSISVQQMDNVTAAKDMRYEAPTKGLGEGWRVGAGFSYIVNDFINIGLDVDYFSSTISKTRDSTAVNNFTSGIISQTTFNESNTISYDAQILTFSPHISFKAISRPKWFLYNKVGAIVVFRPNSTETHTTNTTSTMEWSGFFRDSSSSTRAVYDWGIKNPSLGFMGGVGLQFKLTERLRSFAEVQFSHVVFVAKTRTLLSFQENGVEQVKDLSVSERVTEFEKDFRTDNWIPDPSRPNKGIIQRIPITYVGAQAGFAFRF